MTQLDLFADAKRIAAQDRRRQNHVPPYQPSSETSRLGAMSAAEHAGTQEGRYLAALYGEGVNGMTDHEAVAATGMALSTINARRNSAMDRGYVVDSGTTRPGPTGVANTVWVHKAFAGGAR